MKGLTKSMELRNGAQGDYWIPTNIHIHCPSQKMEVRFELFYNKSAYEAGKNSIGPVKNIVIDIPDGVHGEIEALIPTVQAQDESPNNLPPDKMGEQVPGYFNDAVVDSVRPKQPPNPRRR